MRAALYIRVSSMGQARDGYSLEFQEQILRDFCSREGHTVVEVYRDGGASGSNTQRKDLQRLIDDAKQQRFDLVLIFRVDRFSRDPVDLLALVRTLEASRIRLRSVTEAVDASDPAGELMLTILGAIGKFVRANIIQNAMLGKTKRAQAGKYTGGKVPFGYVVGDDGKYSPDDSEWVPGITKAELVRKAFDLYLESASSDRPGTDYVIKWFTARGIPSPDGIGWTKTTLAQMLRHPVYCGTFAYAKTTQPMGKSPKKNPKADWVTVADAHEPLVSQAVFDQVQELKATLRAGGRLPSQEVKGGLLTGFASCADCGAVLSFRRISQAGKAYYVCGSKVNDSRVRRGTACTEFPFIRHELLENFVWAEIKRVAEDPATVHELLAMIRAGAAPQLDALTADLPKLTKRLADLEGEQMTITTAYAQKKLPEHIWQKQMERLEQDREKLTVQLRKIEEEINGLKRHPALAMDPDKVIAYLQKVFSAGVLSHEEKRQALALLVKRKGITVTPQGQIKITLQFPMSEVACALDLVKLDAVSKPS